MEGIRDREQLDLIIQKVFIILVISISLIIMETDEREVTDAMRIKSCIGCCGYMPGKLNLLELR